jgi:hypothetical protein
MLVLDVHARPELLQVKTFPVDADLFTYLPRLLGGGSSVSAHRDSSTRLALNGIHRTEEVVAEPEAR